MAIGTPHYLSPEICKRLPYNHKSDMWSLGCVLYEMCSLQLAFPAENFMALVQSICRGGHRVLPGHYSSKLSDLVQVLLRPVPERRPSAEQLLTASKLEKEVKLYLAYVGGLKEKETGSGSTVVQDQGKGPASKGPGMGPSSKVETGVNKERVLSLKEGGDVGGESVASAIQG